MLSKPSLEPSAGSSAETSTSSASRSRIALAYSVRFRRCSAGVSRPPWGQPRGRAALPARRRTHRAPRAGRGAPLGGIMPVLTLRTTFSQRSRPRRPSRLQRIQHQPASLRALVVAGDAVLLQQRRFGVAGCRAGGAGVAVRPRGAHPRRCCASAAGAALRTTTASTRRCRPADRKNFMLRCVTGARRGSRQQLFDQRDRAGLRLGGMRGEEHALRPRHRRAPFLVLHVQLRALLDRGT